MERYRFTYRSKKTKEKNWKKTTTTTNQSLLTFYFHQSTGKKQKTGVHVKTQFRVKNKEIISIITADQKWHYSAVKSISRALQCKSPKHNGDYYWINSVHSEQKKKTKMTEAHNEVLKYKQNKKSTKIFIIYGDIESLLENTHIW